MATTRVQADTYLDAILSGPYTLAGLSTWDVAIDTALLAVGETTSTDPYTGSDLAYRLVLRWAGLDLVYHRVLDRVNLSLDGPQTSKSYSDAVKNLKEALDAARAAASPYLTDDAVQSGYATAISHQHDVYAIETPYP